jgi:hypothetical protein
MELRGKVRSSRVYHRNFIITVLSSQFYHRGFIITATITIKKSIHILFFNFNAKQVIKNLALNHNFGQTFLDNVLKEICLFIR